MTLKIKNTFKYTKKFFKKKDPLLDSFSKLELDSLEELKNEGEYLANLHHHSHLEKEIESDKIKFED